MTTFLSAFFRHFLRVVLKIIHPKFFLKFIVRPEAFENFDFRGFFAI